MLTLHENTENINYCNLAGHRKGAMRSLCATHWSLKIGAVQVNLIVERNK